MDYIYEAMNTTKEVISYEFNKREAKYKDAFTIIDEGWEDQLHHLLHAAGHFFNSGFFYDDASIESMKKLRKRFMIVYQN